MTFFRRPPVWLMLLIMLTGIVLCAIAWPMDYYTDQAKIDAIQRMDVEVKDYYTLADSLRTSKAMLLDLGTGLISFSITMLFFFYKRPITSFRDILGLKANPYRRMILHANLVWLALLPALICYLDKKGSRGDFAPDDDIANALSVTIGGCAIMCLILPLNTFLLVLEGELRLPAPLFYRPEKYTFKLFCWEIFFDSLLLLNIASLLFFIVDGNYLAIPVCLYFTYILLLYRAGKLNMSAS
ncbi:hypothetical protein [Chitinophaga sp. Cy-1792]|uniref:hypothetical protein n=1 Tax=Chitinophaga sp. Cy-1792 TaxID=2608339 RepID=UPI00141F9604|nr:hypothetical protein [Chitinophaga sp. Cy-1792]NIG54912.1 hypothetical protein [Chitinophaga sp. Cy-1792]